MRQGASPGVLGVAAQFIARRPARDDAARRRASSPWRAAGCRARWSPPCPATVTSRGRPLRDATGPSGANSSVSMPHGTTLMDRRGTPRRVRSDSSSVLPASTALALRPIAGSSRIRSGPAQREGVMPALGDAQGMEGLHHRDAQPAGGGEGGQAAGPAQRVHDIRPVLAQPVAQRPGEGRHPGEQLPLVGGRLRRGAKVLNACPGGQLAVIRQARVELLRVHGHLVAVARQLAGQLRQPDPLRIGLECHGGQGG